MENKESRRNPNPREGANIVSVTLFKWLFGTYYTGYKRELEISDLYAPLKDHSSHNLGNQLSCLWQEECDRCQKTKKKYAPSLSKTLVRCFSCDIISFGVCLGILELIIRIAQPIILAYLLRYFSGQHDMEKSEAFIWGSGIVIELLLECLTYHPIMYAMMHIGMKIRVACCSLIYRKLLKISRSAPDSKTSVGQIINLLSNDVNRLDYSVLSSHYLWISPIQTAIIAYLLYKEVDMAASLGLFALLLFVPILLVYGKLVSYFITKLVCKTDERLKLTYEIIKGIKVIKMYAWEKPFALLINRSRKKEVKVVRNNLVTSEICWSFDLYVPRICIFLTILAYVFFGNDINAEKVYMVTAYYNIIRTTLYLMFPLAIKELSEALVSLKRLQIFLMSNETQNLLINKNYVKSQISNSDALSMKNVTVKWNSRSKFEALKQLNFRIKPKSLTAIIGQVGAGKTTIFHTILSEVPWATGQVEINGKISYASQEAWIFTSSIRQNILFGKPMNKDRYDKVIDVCQLRRDLQLLPCGDNTLASEKGANLSGGQCSRINLARAIYYEADIYLLDDPLSAVDTHVSKAIFEECIKTFLKDKTVVLITHQCHLLKHVDHIIYIENGKTYIEGTYSELLGSEIDLKKMMRFENESDEIPDNDERAATEDSVASKSTDFYQEENEELESRTLGKIKLQTYSKYLAAAGSILLVAFTLLICVACQLASTGSDYFITYWVNMEEKGANFTILEDDVFRGRSWYIYVYGSIVIFTVFITLIQSCIFFNMCMKISKNLHAWILKSIIHAKMSFFNSNPVGRIMNRFSKDMGIIDTRLPQTLMDVVTIGLKTISVIILVLIVNVWFILPVVFISITAYLLRKFYIKPCRSIKRLEGITRSPVFNHVSASIQGLTTIRALHAQNILTREFDNHQDLHSSAWFLFFSGSRAFGMYIEMLTAFFLAIVVYSLLAIHEISLAGDVGLIVTQILMLSGSLQWGIRQTTELENQMTSVERILEYADIPQEPVLDNNVESRPLDKWPKNGKIEFKNVDLIYDRQNNLALMNLNFIAEPDEMIGVVGRTGAGKSSIISAIFRLVDIKGEILIDDVPTDQIPLQDLRSRISIIPQEPVLFAGSLRNNLDPFEEHSDHVLWLALEDVELKQCLDSDLGLDMLVMEGGSNFSVGQRQLLCLARAIIRNHKILILDEATANVDPGTDELIQRAIRKKLKNCTVIVVAHRLNTVIDSDKILVMDAGQVKEFDHPYILLQKKDGIFSNMVKQTGAFMAKSLHDIAKSNYESKNNFITTRL
ncbi:probable multidrug resistance-associated protein lethal(2)03659 [Copidosoma floridanum]|uniref:probable multidrug resistance-associated protein lethal(2)03659 n=1 Tax=Copidosoma floridanum TaxID=29053 RepID=UPI0006C99736|nr:probable multidrug resistance-associated protein lethal(2)03659 [Copidosoma floridanum]